MGKDRPDHRDALRLVREKIDALKTEIDAWEKLTLSTDVS